MLHHPGYNVAYWNLPQRLITEKDGQWSANDKELRFVHFSGNNLDDPDVFSRHSQQVTVESIGDLHRLLDYYREQVFLHGHELYRKLPYAFSWEGRSGVNLHTPKELDMSSKDGSDEGQSVVSELRIPPGEERVREKRVHVPLTTLNIARRLCGGWRSLANRVWRAYSQHGWKYVKKKILEVNEIHAFTDLPSPVYSEVEMATHREGKILYVDWEIPKPDKDGGSRDATLLMRSFRALGYAVTFLPVGLKYEKGYYESLQNDGIKVLCYPEVGSIEAWLIENAADYEICFMARGPVVWPYLTTLKQAAPLTKLVFYTVDLHYLREMRQAELNNDDKGVKAAKIVREKELDLIRGCDLTILLSNEELYTVRSEIPEASLAVLPIVFDDIPEVCSPIGKRHDIVFIGSFLHSPNIDAVLYFVDSIFPLIQQRLPDVKFKVVGADAPESIQRLAENPNIVILGFVKHLEPLLEDVRLTVAPIRYESGFKGENWHESELWRALCCYPCCCGRYGAC